MCKTVLSFYCDDTNPYSAPPGAFETFLDFVSAEGIAGESSVILGYGFAEHGLLSRPTTDLQHAYIESGPPSRRLRSLCTRKTFGKSWPKVY